MRRKSPLRNPNAQRQAAFVRRQAERGLVRVRYWLTAEEREAVERLIARMRLREE